LVVPGHDYVTLLTCTPYMVNTHRLIVRGHQVDYVPEVEERLIAENEAAYFYKTAFFITLGILIFVLFLILVDSIKKKRAKKKAKKAKLEELKGISHEDKKE
ncbi:MAG: class C sortase, partial [Gallicola sp.]|nr:class C sortase [Gallicola sp.]